MVAEDTDQLRKRVQRPGDVRFLEREAEAAALVVPAEGPGLELVEDGQQQGALVGEVVVDGAYAHPGARRDRSQISSAVCAPVIWEGRLLGVLNVSINEGEGRLDGNALQTIESLVHRFAMILDRFLRLQAVRNGEFFRFMEEELSRDTGHPQAVANTLQRWADDLKEISGADHAALGVLTGDGDLFLAHPDRTEYESPPLPEKTEVLSTGRPLVLRPGDRSDVDPTDVLSEVTVFVLPGIPTVVEPAHADPPATEAPEGATPLPAARSER